MTKEELETIVRQICLEGLNKSLEEYGKYVSPEIIGKIFYIGFNTGLDCGRYTIYDKKEK